MLLVADEAIKTFDYYILGNIYANKGEVMNDQWAEMAARFSEAYVCMALK